MLKNFFELISNMLIDIAEQRVNDIFENARRFAHASKFKRNFSNTNGFGSDRYRIATTSSKSTPEDIER